MQVGGRRVARPPGVDHQDRAAGPGEDQGCGQTGGASADDGYVVLTHAPRLGLARQITYERCRLRESGVR